ncbi:hypothetical protein Tco_1471704, partial [Tanacetum coccineum]
ELEAENSNLKSKIQNDDHDEMIKHSSRLEVEHLNLQLKYQHLKERRGNKKSVTSSYAPAFDSVFKHSEADTILDFKALDFQNKDLTAKVNALHDLNERFRAENEKFKQHYKELYDSIKLTRAKTIEKTTSLLTKIENLKAQINGKPKCVTMPAEKPKVLAPGTLREIVKEARNFDSGCSKHITEDRLRLRNFVKKFIGIVRFGNDHFGAIMGYRDYVIDLEVALRKHSCHVRDVNGVDLIKGNCCTNLYTISVEDMMKSSPICLLSKASKNKSWLWHRQLNHLNFGTINDLA